MGGGRQPSQSFRFGLVSCLCVILNLHVADMASVNVDQSGIIEEVTRALAGRSDMSMVVQYLAMSKDELTASLTSQEDVEGYTFFAPKNWAFIRMLPQDVADPFHVDSELRNSVLLHHFANRKLSPNDLKTSSEVLMADGKPSKLSPAKLKTGLAEINGGTIEAQPIPLGGNLGNVYLVDRVFTTHEEIEKSLKKHPPKETPWGPIDSPGNNPEVESQTVVVDLLAEFFADPANAEVH